MSEPALYESFTSSITQTSYHLNHPPDTCFFSLFNCNLLLMTSGCKIKVPARCSIPSQLGSTLTLRWIVDDHIRQNLFRNGVHRNHWLFRCECMPFRTSWTVDCRYSDIPFGAAFIRDVCCWFFAHSALAWHYDVITWPLMSLHVLQVLELSILADITLSNGNCIFRSVSLIWSRFSVSSEIFWWECLQCSP